MEGLRPPGGALAGVRGAYFKKDLKKPVDFGYRYAILIMDQNRKPSIRKHTLGGEGMTVRQKLLVGGAICGLLADVAHAQTDTGGVSDANEAGLEEIVVTAQKRAENMQDVPIAITAMTSAYAENVGIKSTLDIQMAAPAVNWGATVGGANISIRGITGTGSAGDESANAVYIDGVYNPVGGAAIFGFNNIERIEVLKGPQGTLFGRNASGGAIQIITRNPSHDFGGSASIGYGNYQTLEAQSYLTGGLSSNLAADVAFYFNKMYDGWGTNAVTGNDAYKGRMLAVRSKWLWSLGDSTTITGIYSHNENQAPTSGGAQVLPSQTPAYQGFYNTRTTADMYNRTNQDNASLRIEHEMDWATLVNIASLDLTEQLFRLDADGSPASVALVGAGDSFTDSKSYTEELQILSPSSSAVKWVLGAYYYYNRQRRDPLIFQGLAFPGGQRIIYSAITTNSYSAFGQATVPVTDSFNLTAGLRYTKDDRRVTGHKLEGTPAVPVDYTVVATGAVVPVVNQKNSSSKLTWHFSADYAFTPDVMAYASVSRGFKSGFFNMTAPETPAVDPQVVDAYEVGLKTTLFDNKVRFNIAAFYDDFKDIQLRKADVAGIYFLNAASATIKGIDVDFEARPVPALTLQGGAVILDGKYGRFLGGPTFGYVNGVFTEGTGDLSGRNTVRTPDFTASFGGVYTIESAVGDIALAANIYYNDGFYFDPENRVEQPSYTILNGSIGWTSANETFNVKVWGKNLLKEKYFTEFNTAARVGDLYFPAAPRTYGVTIGVTF